MGRSGREPRKINQEEESDRLDTGYLATPQGLQVPQAGRNSEGLRLNMITTTTTSTRAAVPAGTTYT